MTRNTRKRKSPCSGKGFAERMAAARAAKARKGSGAARKGSRRPKARPEAGRGSSGPVRVATKPLGRVASLQLERPGPGGRPAYFLHQFGGRGATVHQVEGQQGVLVIRGDFRVDQDGFIHG